MRIAYFDAFSGISGDMTIGAFVDAGVDFEELKSEIQNVLMQVLMIILRSRFRFRSFLRG